jgi:hypothetical protein
VDYSTIDGVELAKLGPCELRPGLVASESVGCGCYGDPPGYPTYFLRSVYTGRGDNPASGPYHVIRDGAGELYPIPEGEGRSWDDGVLRRLWRPLPLDHPRVRLWLAATAIRLRHCYRDEGRPEHGRPGTLIYPLPSYKLKTFRDDHRRSVGDRQAALDEVNEFNRQERERAEKIATPDNHSGVRQVRKYYPDFAPPPWFLEPPAGLGGIPQWWETDAAAPKPGKCVSRNALGGHNAHVWAHRDDHCQWCGAGRTGTVDPLSLPLS